MTINDIREKRSSYNAQKICRRLHYLLYKKDSKTLPAKLRDFDRTRDEFLVEVNEGSVSFGKKSFRLDDHEFICMENSTPFVPDAFLAVASKQLQSGIDLSFMEYVMEINNKLYPKYVVFINGAYGGASVLTAHAHIVPNINEFNYQEIEECSVSKEVAVKSLNLMSTLGIPGAMSFGMNGKVYLKAALVGKDIFKEEINLNSLINHYSNILEKAKEDEDLYYEVIHYLVIMIGGGEMFLRYFDVEELLRTIKKLIDLVTNDEEYEYEGDVYKGSSLYALMKYLYRIQEEVKNMDREKMLEFIDNKCFYFTEDMVKGSALRSKV